MDVDASSFKTLITLAYSRLGVWYLSSVKIIGDLPCIQTREGRKGVILRKFGECHHPKEAWRLRAMDFKQQAAADSYKLWTGSGYHHSLFGNYFDRLPCSIVV